MTKHTLSIKRSGDTAFLVDLGSLEAAMGMRQRIESDPPEGLSDVVAAATTLLVIATSLRYTVPLIRHIRSLDATKAKVSTGRTIDIPVNYDGSDLREVAAELGMSVDAVVSWHTRTTWTAAFAGFAPGFVYLVGDASVRLPRRASPRTSVPAGSVALADHYSAVYPRSSPGGWNLIGRTDAILFDESSDDPALIHPGDRVQFWAERDLVVAQNHHVEVEAEVEVEVEAAADSTDEADVLVVYPGVSATIQDLGRPGHASLGVGPAGAMDIGALKQANRLVGNPVTSSVIEVLGSGTVIRALTDQVLSVTGAASALDLRAPAAGGLTLRRQPDVGRPFALLAGEELEVVAANRGTWSYVAFRGGINARDVLGSRSRDTHSELGPDPLQAGSGVRVHVANLSAVVADEAVTSSEAEAKTEVVTNTEVVMNTEVVTNTEVQIRVMSGPRDDWFTPDAHRVFFSTPWTVTNQFSRMAMRLTGQPLERAVRDELQSEGLVRGSIQVPPNGLPLIFGADYPVTGGYPVIAVVNNADLDTVAQLSPGSVVRFVREDPPPLA